MALAVRRVINNKGRKTPGIDGVGWTTDEDKIRAVYWKHLKNICKEYGQGLLSAEQLKSCPFDLCVIKQNKFVEK